MYFLDIKLIWTHITHNVMTFYKSLKRPMFCLKLIFIVEHFHNIASDRVECLIFLDKTRVEKLNVSSFRDSVEFSLVQKVSSHLTGRAFSTENSFPHSLSPKTTNKSSRVVISERFFIKGFEDGNNFFHMVL